MNNNWYGAELLHLLADQGSAIDLTLEAKGERSVTLARQGAPNTVELTANHESEASLRLGEMLRMYPHAVRINGEELSREKPPSGIALTRYDYSSDAADSYRVSHLGTSEHPASSHQLNAIIAGVRFRIEGHEHPWQLTYHVRQEPAPTSHWQRAATLRCSCMLQLEYQDLDQLSWTNQGNLYLYRKSPIWDRLRAETIQRLENAVALKKAPPPEEGKIYQMVLGYDVTMEEMHGGGAPIFVAGTPVRLCDTKNSPAEYITAARALYDHQQDLVPVAGPWGDGEGQQDKAEQMKALKVTGTVNGRSPDQKGEPFAPMRHPAQVTLRSLDGSLRATVPANLIIEGDRYTPEVTWREGSCNPGAMADLLTQGFWNQQDFNECAYPEDAEKKMRQDFLEQATAGMLDLEQGFRMHLQRAVDGIGTSVPWPETALSVTSRNGRYTLIYNSPAEQAPQD